MPTHAPAARAKGAPEPGEGSPGTTWLKNSNADELGTPLPFALVFKGEQGLSRNGEFNTSLPAPVPDASSQRAGDTEAGVRQACSEDARHGGCAGTC